MAVELNDVQDPGVDLQTQTATMENTSQAATYGQFPYPEHINRLNHYDYYTRLFEGDHFTAFNIAIDNEQWGRNYARLRYVKVNFAGLISKVIADFLFSEPVSVKVEKNQEFVDALWRTNKMDTQLYESALSNSYLGDALFKNRVGKRHSMDKKSTVIIEDTTPTIYFPLIDGFNVRQAPETEELAWTFKLNGKTYLRKEIHKRRVIRNEVYEMKGNKIVTQVPLTILGIPGLLEEVPTKIDRSLLEHVSNWKTGNRFFGLSDYHDLDSLFFAINNRMTKTDNILDKHSDPILMVPPGVLDDNGAVRKKALGVIEVGEGEQGKPEYIVWDASLENAYKEAEKLVDYLLMTAEISPDVFGMGKGQSDSGRALKYKLLRTIAKAARKKLYYDTAIKEVIYTAQTIAYEWGLEVDGVKMAGEPEMPEVVWNDGIPVDEKEQIEVESMKIDAGVQSKKGAIMKIDQIDEKAAEEKLKDIDDEKPTITLPTMNLGKNNGTNQGANNTGAGGGTPSRSNGGNMNMPNGMGK